MNETSEVRKLPVVAYATFKSFFSKVEDGLPGRIDRGVLKYTSGAIATQLMHGFRALGLTDEQGQPNKAMEDLASAYAQNDKEALRAMLRKAYPTILDGKFNLARATHSQLREKFESMGISGDTIRKSMTFFVAAAKDAEIEVSRFVSAQAKATGSPHTSNGGRKTKPSGARKRSREKPATPSLTQAQPMKAFWESVLAKLPAFDPTWSQEAQANWIDMLERITKQVAGEKR